MLQEKTIILFINIGQVILQTPFNLIMFNTLFGCKYKNFFVSLRHKIREKVLNGEIFEFCRR